MYRNWRNLIKPRGLYFDSEMVTDTYGEFVAKPLERGYGITLGNSLRRILLSSLQGAAVVNVLIEGVSHEFSTIPGVVEDVTNIILNLKSLKLVIHTGAEDKMYLDISGEREVRASDIQTSANIEILNPDLLIATLAPEGRLKMEMTIKLGSGYVPAEQNKTEDDPIGTIALDAVHSPILQVNYNVTNARVGQRTDYDCLTMKVKTDGSVRPDDAIAFAAKILKEQLQIFINFEEVDEPIEEEAREEKVPLNPNLYRKVDELELSVRSANCLQNAKIKFIGELCQKTEAEMLKTKNFGRKSLNEIKEILSEMGLSLGMKLDGFDSADAEKYQPKDVE
ncbi:DNA-directed RNA polymerase subunit alpha [bacterium]|nr:DNA-directed RNA polymerase subunit alpha [bacterium]